MVNYLVPGYDMYKFLYFAAIQFIKGNDSDNNLKIIAKIFKYFYGRDDPYSLVNENLDFNYSNLNKVNDEFGKMATYSIAGSYSPSLLIDFLLKNFKIKTVNVTQRNIYQIQDFQSYDYYFDKILNLDVSKLKDKVNSCDYKSNSFLVNVYINYILNSYLKNLGEKSKIPLSIKDEKTQKNKDKELFDKFVENINEYGDIFLLENEFRFIIREKVGREPVDCEQKLREFEYSLHLNTNFDFITKLNNLLLKVYLYKELKSLKLIGENARPFNKNFEKNPIIDFYESDYIFINNNLKWREVLLYSTLYSLIENIDAKAYYNELLYLLKLFSSYGFYVDDIITDLMKLKSK